MTHPITKEDVAWLLVRSAGIAFVWLAFSKLAGFIFAAYLLTSHGLREINNTLSSALSWNIAWPQAFWFLVYSAMAYYLLVNGSHIHRLLCSSPKNVNHSPHESQRPGEQAGRADGDQPSN